jgi:hypothetical protein
MPGANCKYRPGGIYHGAASNAPELVKERFWNGPEWTERPFLSLPCNLLAITRQESPLARRAKIFFASTFLRGRTFRAGNGMGRVATRSAYRWQRRLRLSSRCAVYHLRV